MTDLPFAPFASIPPVPVTVIAVVAVIALAGVAVVAVGLRYRCGDSFAIGVLRAVNLAYTRVVHGVRPGNDPLPKTGPALLVSNHRSGVDPLVIGAHTNRVVRFMMAREYYLVPLLRRILDIVKVIPVNRDGHDFAATKRALRALQNGEVVGIFPEGRIRHLSPDTPFTESGADDAVKHGAALLALRANVPIIPVYVDGTPPTDSVTRAICSFSKSRVAFGEPLHLDAPRRKPSRADLEDATQQIMDAITALKTERELQKPLARAYEG